MNREEQFNNILDECLERVLFNGEAVDQCLTSYPQYADELAPLLRTALETKTATMISPRPDFRQRAAHEFQSALREAEAESHRTFFSWQPRWAIAVMTVVALALGSASAVFASSNSMPDDLLYPVKTFTESVQLALTFSDVDKAELYVKLADKRINEIVQMADEGNVSQVEKTTERLSQNLLAATSLTAKENAQPMLMEMQPMTTDDAPPPADAEAPFATQVTPSKEAPTALPEPSPAPEVPAEAAPPPSSDNEPLKTVPRYQEVVPDENLTSADILAAGSEENEELKNLVNEQTVENSRLLEAALETAPEAVRDALRQAIEVADTGYQQVLNNLYR
jgi:hypothetical protein